jgi:excisionase family DNA binding protein
MQAYASAGRLPVVERLGALDRTAHPASTGGQPEHALIDQILGRLADLAIDRLMELTSSDNGGQADDWLDARGAAAYLGVHRDTVRKLAAQRAIPVNQDGPGCRLYFCRGELDDRRRSARSPGAPSPALRAVR